MSRWTVDELDVRVARRLRRLSVDRSSTDDALVTLAALAAAAEESEQALRKFGSDPSAIIDFSSVIHPLGSAP